MGANGKDDDGSWPWNDKWLKSIKEDHDKFFTDLKNKGQRLERELRNDDNNATSSPFAAFKKFVDSNFHALTDGFKNFPSNVAELRAKMQREQERLREEELDISWRWTGSDDTPDHIQLELLRSTEQERRDAFNATTSLLVEAQRRNAHVPKAKIEALFNDPESTLGYLDRLASPMLALGGAWYYMPETGDKLPTADSWRWLAPQPRWLSVDWFKRSPYSPIRLEAHPDLELEGAKWRAAFEDLMDATLGKPMGSMERVGMRALHGKPQSTYYGPGLEWMLSLQCRGILPPLLPRAHNDVDMKNTLLDMRNESIIDTIIREKKDLALKPEHSMRWHTSFNEDFTDLMSEVANKATSDFEAEPLAELVPYKIKPATEQDMYDSPYIWSASVPSASEDHSDSLEDEETQYPSGQKTSEDKVTPVHDDPINETMLYEDWFEALGDHDVETATAILNEWFEIFGDVEDLVDEHTDAFMVMNEALRKSNLPDDEPRKQEAFEQEVHIVDPVDVAGLERIQRRLDLMKRFDELTDEDTEWPLELSNEDLEQLIERLEEEHANLERMVGQKKMTKPVVQRKPEVLSALTTTETTRLPDGTVTTKVVLKKRFADGREETSESVHTTNERLEQQHSEEEKPKKKGWFWS